MCSGFISRPATVLGTRLRQVNVCPIQELRSQLLSSVSGQPLDLVPASEEEEEEESELLALVATDRYGRPPIVLETRLRPIRSQLLPSVSDLVPASEENAPRSGNEASQPAVGKYKCGQCGQPKKGHGELCWVRTYPNPNPYPYRTHPWLDHKCTTRSRCLAFLNASSLDCAA